MKMIEITYCSTKWSDTCRNGKYDLLIIEENRKRLINIDCIVSMSSTPVIVEKSGSFEKRELYYVGTNIAYGRGINGVDYESYYVTPDTYERLLNVIEVI